MAANRAARYDRKLLMMNQEEITRLRRSTQKIRGKVREEEAGTSRDKVFKVPLSLDTNIIIIIIRAIYTRPNRVVFV